MRVLLDTHSLHASLVTPKDRNETKTAKLWKRFSRIAHLYNFCHFVLSRKKFVVWRMRIIPDKVLKIMIIRCYWFTSWFNWSPWPDVINICCKLLQVKYQKQNQASHGRPSPVHECRLCERVLLLGSRNWYEERPKYIMSSYIRGACFCYTSIYKDEDRAKTTTY